MSRGPSGFRRDDTQTRRVALVGNPNTGKTSLFNALTGLRAKTANFAGTTVERRSGRMLLGHGAAELLDLPGIYSLRATTPEERITRDILKGDILDGGPPDAVIIIVDATNLERNLFMAGQVIDLRIPTVVALNMVDEAEQMGIHIDAESLGRELGCPVVPTVARNRKGVDHLRRALERQLGPDPHVARTDVRTQTEDSCPFHSRFTWSEDVCERCVQSPGTATSSTTERLDRVLTHPLVGVLAFLSVMLLMFSLIFQVATVPMDMIEGFFGTVGGWLQNHLPQGLLRSLLVDGIIGGVGGILVFLPQICILFFFLALLEDSGYLSRAAFVIDRYMRKVGLPGTAFVPMLSAHACAIPAIMATRVIDNERDRLVTILVAPLMSCSARIPVYVMLTALLFPTQPVKAALLFTGAYLTGIVAALFMAFVFKKTILRGESRPIVLELPPYRRPSIRKALREMLDRAMIFVKQAGTIILIISIGLWVLATFPRSEPPPQAVALQAEAAGLAESGREEDASELRARAAELTNQHALEQSFAGTMGQLIEPVIRPLGFDWQIGIGIISSFAAREVIVSTLAIVYGVGEEAVEGESTAFYDTLRNAKRRNGEPVFTAATCASLLVFYILAMQCLPTQAITRRETNSWKWPLFQLGYMTVLAYVASLAVYQILTLAGIG